MGYYIDLNALSLDAYENRLKTIDMIPSRMILKEKPEKRFDYFRSLGLKSVGDLLKLLKRKDSFSALCKVECLSEEYLTILLRELNSIQPKPNKLKDFIDISSEIINQLEKFGIKDTLTLFEKVIKKENRKALSSKTGINESEIMKLTKLADLSRIRWVGATFARVLYESGFDTVEKVAQANPKELYDKITGINREKNLYKGQIGLKDMKLCIDTAKEVSREIEY